MEIDMEMRMQEAKIVLYLEGIPRRKRDVHHVAAAVGCNYYTAYHTLRIMVCKGLLRSDRSKNLRKFFFLPKEEAVLAAKKTIQVAENVL